MTERFVPEPVSQGSRQKNLQQVPGMIGQEASGSAERCLGGDENSNFLESRRSSYDELDLNDRFDFSLISNDAVTMNRGKRHSQLRT